MMGFFNFLKRKKQNAQPANGMISFEMLKPANDHYDPWDRRRQSSYTDYANVNFLRFFKNVHPLSDDPYQFGRAVSYNLHIYDPIGRRGELLKQGYLRLADPAETLSTYKVTELKEILRSHALPMTGKKDTLISRIISSVDLKKINLPQMCCLSEKGIDFINQNQDLVSLYGNKYGVTYEEFIAAKKEAPAHPSYNDIIWVALNRREMLSNGNYGTRVWTANCRARFLEAEGKPAQALEQFIIELYLEMNDPGRVVPASIRKYDSDPELQPSQLSSDLIKSIFDLKAHFRIDMIDKCYQRTDVPKILIQRKKFENLLNDIFAGNEIDVRNYLPKGLR